MRTPPRVNPNQYFSEAFWEGVRRKPPSPVRPKANTPRTQWRKRQQRSTNSKARGAYSRGGGGPPPRTSPRRTPQRTSPRAPTLENFGRAPRTRRTLNNYSRDWFGMNLHGQPLNRRLALKVHPNKHGGNKRAEELMKLLSQLLENKK